MSGHTEDVLVLDGAREREIAFVQKPFTARLAARTVSRALEPAPATEADAQADHGAAA